jgi:hypothetical protein
MRVEVLRILEHVHGHLGWLAVAALVHPALLLRNPRRRARLAVIASVSIATATALLGGYLYYFFSHQLRRALYVASPVHGMLFERKEHLAFGALALAWAAALVHLFGRGDVEDPGFLARARFVHWAFVAAAVLAATVGVLGTVVASFKSF